MRLERIALRGFLSHRDTDWSPNGARLVTLVGPNGAGKSSLLDAIRYALFDDARARTDDLVRLGATDMAATIEFAYASERYRVTRGRTTRSGGKTFLELAIAEGDAWRPLTGETIRETQQRIEELLRLDAATFGTAVLLAQGEADRFAAATPAERKRVLGSVIGLDVWERLETKGRERARDLDVTLRLERQRSDRLEADIEAFADAGARRDAAITGLAQHGTLVAAAMTQRDVAETSLRDLAAALADIDAAERDVRRIETELGSHKARFDRARGARATALDSIERATRVLSEAPAVEAATAKAATARARVAELEAAEDARDQALTVLAAAEERLRASQHEHDQAVRALEARRERARAAVAALEDQQAHLDLVTCPNCEHRFEADPGDVAGRLEAARGVARDAESVVVAEPRHLARDRAAAEAARATLERAPSDRAALQEARSELLAHERTAARAGEIEAARTAERDGRAHVAAAEVEIEAVKVEGRQANEALVAARARVEAGAELRRAREAAEAELASAREVLAALEQARTQLEVAKAAAIADLERRAALESERGALEASLVTTTRAIERLRCLVAAYGAGGVPARIIEGTVPELEGHVNDVLDELRPGMTLSIRAQRARKGGDGLVETLDLVVRDAAGERPLGLFSGGERMSVSLAIAVGLSRLVARRAGTAIRTLLVDEPDGLDGDSRRALGQALRVLAHAGDLERIVVVTHTPDLAEFSDAVYAVSRGDEGSVVQLVA